MNPRPKKLRVLRWLPDRWMLTRGVRDRRVLHLSFDDGPNETHTPPLLDLLAAHDARADFFLIGERAEQSPQLVERLVREGHALGNHSWHHRRFDAQPAAAQRAEIDRTDALLARFDGRTHRDFRPPRGLLPRGLMLDCLRHGTRIAYWSYDTLDYSRRPVAELIASARRHPPRPGDILLMHDDAEASLRLLEAMLPEWRAAGFAFELLPRSPREVRAARSPKDIP
ncbi:MAG: polysaccharide deacetylase family protein [Lysobacteraceae bacterium]